MSAIPANASPLPPTVQLSTQQAIMTVDHSLWKQLLGRYIRATADGVNLFAYGAVTAPDRKQLKDYVAHLEATKVQALPRNEQMAFWINLYNAKTIDIVLDHYPVKSIRDISLGGGLFSTGPWKKQVMTVEGQSLSLDNVEHDILRKQWKDPRVHYAVNCASFSCPNLADKPFTGQDLDTMLDAGAKAYINHPRGVTFRGDRLVLSQIFEWYRKDFGSTDAEVIAHLSRYANPDLKAKLARVRSIADYGYDWSLNDVK
jgi:hypothetical protein